MYTCRDDVLSCFQTLLLHGYKSNIISGHLLTNNFLPPLILGHDKNNYVLHCPETYGDYGTRIRHTNILPKAITSEAGD